VLSIGGQGAVLRPLDFVKNSREKHGKEKRNGREKKIGTRKKRRQGWGCKLGGDFLGWLKGDRRSLLCKLLMVQTPW